LSLSHINYKKNEVIVAAKSVFLAAMDQYRLPVVADEGDANDY
jgi:hypothetical protein